MLPGKLLLELLLKLFLPLQDKLLLLLKLPYLQLEVLTRSHSENAIKEGLKMCCVGVRLRYAKNAKSDLSDPCCCVGRTNILYASYHSRPLPAKNRASLGVAEQY